MAFDNNFPIDNTYNLPHKEFLKEKESCLVWGACSQAIKSGDLELARKLKVANELRQREEESKRQDEGSVFEPIYFKRGTDSWRFVLEHLFHSDYSTFEKELKKIVKR